MESMIVYSSKTGNTKMLAEALIEVVPDTALHRTETMPSTENCDVIALGFWVDKGMPDKQSINFLKTLQNKNILLFGTLGSFPDSNHARDCIKMAEKIAINEELGENKNRVLGTFMCMGKIDPKVYEVMAKMFSMEQFKAMAKEVSQEEAAKHPNKQDLENLKKFALDCFAQI